MTTHYPLPTTHPQRPIYEFARHIVRSMPVVEKLLMNYIRGRRKNYAEQVLEAGNFYPAERAQILADYAYSTLNTHRGIMQVINLESVLRYVETFGIEGAFVECGTYTGGASAYALQALLRLRTDKPTRHYWGFDSFEGMPTPSALDGDHGAIWVKGKLMNELDSAELGELIGHDCNKADYGLCLSYLQKTGYPPSHIHLVKGWFQETLVPNCPHIGPIAVLRTDGDFYESTKCVFDSLYGQVVQGGIVVIDDYGSFQGCRRATEEFFVSRNIKPHLVYVENGIRYFVKHESPNA